MTALDGFPGVRVGFVSEAGNRYFRVEFDDEMQREEFFAYFNVRNLGSVMLPLNVGPKPSEHDRLEGWHL